MGLDRNIDITPQQRKTILSLLDTFLPNTTAWVYGSRVKWTSKPNSDLDMVVFSTSKQVAKVSLLQEAFDESDLPFRVDLHVWNDVPDQFQKNIEADYLVLQKVSESAISDSWQKVALGDIFNVKHGYAFKGEYFSNSKQSTVLLTPGNFATSGGFKRTKPKYYNGPIPDEYILKSGQVVVTMTDLSKQSDTLGYATEVPKDEITWLHNQRVGLLEFKKEIPTDPIFVSFLLRTQQYRSWIIGSATGTTVKHTSPSRIQSYVCSIPKNIEEQKAIAHILGSLDDKIELNRQMNETLEAMAQALFKSWFVDFDPVIDNALAGGNEIPETLQLKAAARQALTNQSGNDKLLPDHIRQQFPCAFEFSETMGWIPEGWESISVNEALDINPRVTLRKGDIAPFIDMKALPTSGYAINYVGQKSYSGGAKFNNGDVLLARITPCLENGKTGVVDFLNDDEVGFGSTEFIVLRPKGVLGTPYIACLARDKNFRNHCVQNMVGSSGRQRVQNSGFNSYYLCLPKANHVADLFHKLIFSDFGKMTDQKNEMNTLTKLRDTLLPKLLSGELRIPDAEKLVKEAL